MKKLATIILALTMVFAMALPAFAAEEVTGLDGGAQTATQNVTGIYYPAGYQSDHIYKVTVEWTVHDVSWDHLVPWRYTWNVDSLKYEMTEEPGEIQSIGTPGIEVVVTNRSNDDLGLALAYADRDDSVTTSADTAGAVTSGTAGTAAKNASSTVIGYTDTESVGTQTEVTLNQNIEVANPDAMPPETEYVLGTFTLTITPQNTELVPDTAPAP